MKRFEQRPDPFLLSAIAGSAAAVAIADWIVPLGVVVWIFYLVPIALCLRTNYANAPLMVAAFGSVVILLEMGRMALGMNVPGFVQINRTFGIIVLWGFAWIVRQIVTARLSLQRQQWLRTGLQGLAEQAQGERRIEALGESVIHYVARYLDASVGAIYAHEQGQLHRIAGFALPPGARGERFAVGESLVGQAAAQRETLRVTSLPASYGLTVSSGVGQAAPRELLLAPLTLDGRMRGVIELGFLHPLHDSDVEMLSLMSERIGLAMKAASDRSRLEELLEETQRQAEELQTQQEELRVANEELEEQGNALRESQARLETQQAELEQTNSHLEEQAIVLAEQKASLERTQARLIERGEEVAQASRYKSEFLANMSHELRTPLNSSLILARLLADNRNGNLTAEQVKFAESIYAAGNDLLDLINDILDLSKIESGHMDVKPEAIRLSRLADTLGQAFKPLAADKGIGFAITVDPGTPETIESDPQRLQQILKNLLSNAVKFTEQGEVTLRIASEGQQVHFTVRDTGIGIPANQHAVVFEAFRQADGTTNRKYGGTGLGLSISRELAQLLGGRITLDSAPGHGSTFTLTLPVAYVPVERADAPRQVEPQAPPATPLVARPVPAEAAPAAGVRRPPPLLDDDREQLGDGSRVLLVVEDDQRFAKILYDLAHELGFRCVLATTADEGVELARRHLPVAILLDMNLPDHSGLTVLDRLKRDPSTRHIPVQVASVEDYAQAALEMGAAGYMLKPVKREQLIDTLSSIEDRFTQKVRSVLVVEDDPVQRESICHLLAAQDVRTVPVESAARALEELRSATHDCMVLDISLPDASGFELLETMAQGHQYAFPPVIIYTGRSLSDEEEQRLRRYSRSIIIKGARSPERLLDEVTLFLHQVEANLPADRRRMLQEARRRDAAFEGRRILVVEDDVRNIFALSSILEPLGARLEIARNGREALRVLDGTPGIEMVLMDIMMPEMDGYEAMREIRRREAFAKLPIIALTAKAMRDDKERCLEAGASDYIAKPIDVEQLLSLMRVWMPR
jgi:CheY-like chemotaxis protein/signal transduction histidine kinase